MLCEMDIKDIYTVGENIRGIAEQELSLFTGQNLVDWLIKKDCQVENREDGLKLGRYLVEYRVIHHVEDKYHFLDDPNKSYRFCKDTEVYPRKKTEQQTWVQGLTVMKHFSQEVGTGKKRRKSWKPFLTKGGPTANHFKGKHLMDWLEKNSDFQSRDECRRFFKSLLKLNFIRSSQNDLRFCESVEYWFYVSRLKEDVSKMRRLSRTLLPERSTSVENQKEMVSPTGLTPELMALLATHQSAGTRDRSHRLQLRRTCSVLRTSLSRSSLMASSCSLARSNSSGSTCRVDMRNLSSRSEEEASTASTYSSRESLDCQIVSQGNSARSSTSDDGSRSKANTYCIGQLRAQLAMQRSRNSHSESSTGSMSDLIESADFQKILLDIGRSSSKKNLKQLEEGRKAILCQLEARKYGKPSPICPSSSCPKNLDSVLTRNISSNTSGYGSISDQSFSSSEDDVTSRDSVCSTPIALTQFVYPLLDGTCDSYHEDLPNLSPSDMTPRLSPDHPLPDAETLKVLMSRALCNETATSSRRARLLRRCAFDKSDQQC